LNRDKRDTAEAYLSRVIQRLKDDGFALEENITYRGQTFDYVAKRIRYEISKNGFVATFYLFSEFSSLDKESLVNFSAKSFEYARKVRGLPLPFRLFYGVVCYPVAIVDDIDKDTSEAIRSQAPPKHWLSGEMPVVYSLASGTLYYCEITPMWGGLYYNQMRLTINSMLAP